MRWPSPTSEQTVQTVQNFPTSRHYPVTCAETSETLMSCLNAAFQKSSSFVNSIEMNFTPPLKLVMSYFFITGPDLKIDTLEAFSNDIYHNTSFRPLCDGNKLI